MFCKAITLGPLNGIVGSTVSDATAPGQPVCAFAYSCDNFTAPPTDSFGSGHGRPTFGAVTSTSARYSIATRDNNGQGTSQASCAAISDGFYERVNGTGSPGALQLACDLTSFNANGLTADIVRTGGFGGYLPMLLIGGPEVTATVLTFAEPGSAGTQDITSTAFGTPDLVIFFSLPIAAAVTLGTPALDAAAALGVATRDDANNALWSGGADHAVGTSQAISYCPAIGTSCLVGFNAGMTAVNAEAKVTSWITDGVQVTWSSVSGVARNYYALFVKGVRARLASFQSQTDTTTDITISGIGFAAKGGLVVSACKAADAAGTPSAHWVGSFGAFDNGNGSSTIAQTAESFYDEDNLDVTSSQGGTNYGNVYSRTGNADAEVGAANITSITDDGMIMRMTDADPDQAYGWALFIDRIPTPFVRSGGGDHLRRRL